VQQAAAACAAERAREREREAAERERQQGRDGGGAGAGERAAPAPAPAQAQADIPAAWLRAPAASWQALARAHAWSFSASDGGAPAAVGASGGASGGASAAGGLCYRWSVAAARRFGVALLLTRLRALPTPEQLLLLRRNLARADRDGDGFVSRAEFAACLLPFETPAPRAAEALAKADLDAIHAEAARPALPEQQQQEQQQQAAPAAPAAWAAPPPLMPLAAGGVSPESAQAQGGSRDMGAALAQTLLARPASARFAEAADLREALWLLFSNAAWPRKGGAAAGGGDNAHSSLASAAGAGAGAGAARGGGVASLASTASSLAFADGAEGAEGGAGSGAGAGAGAPGARLRLDCTALVLDLCADPRSSPAAPPALFGAAPGGGGGGDGGHAAPHHAHAHAHAHAHQLHSGGGAGAGDAGGIGAGGVGGVAAVGDAFLTGAMPAVASHPAWQPQPLLLLGGGGGGGGGFGGGPGSPGSPGGGSGGPGAAPSAGAERRGAPRLPGLLKAMLVLRDASLAGVRGGGGAPLGAAAARPRAALEVAVGAADALLLLAHAAGAPPARAPRLRAPPAERAAELAAARAADVQRALAFLQRETPLAGAAAALGAQLAHAKPRVRAQPVALAWLLERAPFSLQALPFAGGPSPCDCVPPVK